MRWFSARHVDVWGMWKMKSIKSLIQSTCSNAAKYEHWHCRNKSSRLETNSRLFWKKVDMFLDLDGLALMKKNYSLTKKESVKLYIFSLTDIFWGRRHTHTRTLAHTHIWTQIWLHKQTVMKIFSRIWYFFTFDKGLTDPRHWNSYHIKYVTNANAKFYRRLSFYIFRLFWYIGPWMEDEIS